MNIDAHYYGILAFARAAGFKKEYAHTIAYASQFVDDAKINHITLNNAPEDVEFEIVSNQPSFFNMATCHSYSKINTFNYEAMVNNTIAFHFVPGCKGENFAKQLRCSEESPIILSILDDLKKEDDLVKLGIALHAYADTFSHQGFSGLLSKVNDIRDCHPNTKIHNSAIENIIDVFRRISSKSFDKYFDKLSPAYGHAQALLYPDIAYLEWEYRYDYSDEFSEQYIVTINNNKERFTEAFKKIQLYLQSYLENNPKYKDDNFSCDNYELLFSVLLKEGSKKEKIKYWKDTFIELRLFNAADAGITDYQDELWLKEAFSNYQKDKFKNRKVDGAELSPNFVESNWYKYFKAVKWYKTKFFNYSSEHMLEIPR